MARLWSAADGMPIGQPMAHDGPVEAVAFPNGTTILTRGFDRMARLRRAPQALEGDPIRIETWAQVVTGLELDERNAVHVLDAETWRQRKRQFDALGGPPDRR